MPTPQPIPSMDAQIAQNAVNVFGCILTGLTDEIGNALAVPMRHVYNSASTQDGAGNPLFPEVVVSCALGQTVAGMGHGQVDEDASGNPIYATLARDTLITLTVRSQLDAQRRYIANALHAGIEFGYWTNPANGQVVDQVVRKWLGEVGLIYKGVDKPRYPRADLSDPRPDAQIYTAELDVRVDAWLTTLGGVQPPVSAVTLTLDATDALQNVLAGWPSIWNAFAAAADDPDTDGDPGQDSDPTDPSDLDD